MSPPRPLTARAQPVRHALFPPDIVAARVVVGDLTAVGKNLATYFHWGARLGIVSPTVLVDFLRQPPDVILATTKDAWDMGRSLEPRRAVRLIHEYAAKDDAHVSPATDAAYSALTAAPDGAAFTAALAIYFTALANDCMAGGLAAREQLVGTLTEIPSALLPYEASGFQITARSTGAPTAVLPGDFVVLNFRPLTDDFRPGKKCSEGYTIDSPGIVWTHFVHGTVERLIVDADDRTVGLVVRRQCDRGHANSPRAIETAIYWLPMLDAEHSVIVSRNPAIVAQPIDTLVAYADSILPADDSGPYRLRINRSDLEAPISVGDQVSLYVRTTDKSGKYCEEIVWGDVSAILCDDTDAIVGLRIEHKFHWPRYTEVAFRDIIRLVSEVRTITGTQYTNFVPLGARTAYPFATTSTWLPATTHGVATYRDTGDFTLLIRRKTASGDIEEREEAPIAPGDEVLLSMIDNRPDTVLGFSYARYYVTDIAFDAHGVAIGLKVDDHGHGDPDRVIRFEDFNRDDSHIESAQPWDSRANRAPGAYAKRRPYQARVRKGYRDNFDPSRMADFFSRMFGGSAREDARYDRPPPTAWTEAPLEYITWLQRERAEDTTRNQATWARWVLGVAASASATDIKTAWRTLRIQYAAETHPDQVDAYTEISKTLNDAYNFLSEK